MNKAGDSEPTGLLETLISRSVYVSNHLVHCSHSWDIPFWEALLYFCGSEYSKALPPTSDGSIEIVHCILIRIGHLSSILNNLEMKNIQNYQISIR